MTEQERYNKFWRTFAEKIADIQAEYGKLSDANKRQVDCVIQCTLKAYSVPGFAEFIRNPPQS